jgi:hypothetical protein
MPNLESQAGIHPGVTINFQSQVAADWGAALPTELPTQSIGKTLSIFNFIIRMSTQ